MADNEGEYRRMGGNGNVLPVSVHFCEVLPQYNLLVFTCSNFIPDLLSHHLAGTLQNWNFSAPVGLSVGGMIEPAVCSFLLLDWHCFEKYCACHRNPETA